MLFCLFDLIGGLAVDIFLEGLSDGIWKALKGKRSGGCTMVR